MTHRHTWVAEQQTNHRVCAICNVCDGDCATTCFDSPTGQHETNFARFGDNVCVWCLEGPHDCDKFRLPDGDCEVCWLASK